MATKQSDAKTILTADKRTVLGKQVKKLRKNGLVPANVFGKDFESLAISVPLLDFTKVYQQAGETGVVYVNVESEEIPTLIKSVQKHPVNDFLLHVDFRKVNLKQKLEAEVPLEFIGEAPGVKEGGVVLYQMDTVTVEALPANFPHAIEIDLEKLVEVGQDIKVGDIAKSSTYEITTDPEMVIASLTAHREESLEPDISTTIPDEVEGAAAEGEGEAAAPAAEAESEENKE